MMEPHLRPPAWVRLFRNSDESLEDMVHRVTGDDRTIEEIRVVENGEALGVVFGKWPREPVSERFVESIIATHADLSPFEIARQLHEARGPHEPDDCRALIAVQLISRRNQ